MCRYTSTRTGRAQRGGGSVIGTANALASGSAGIAKPAGMTRKRQQQQRAGVQLGMEMESVYVEVFWPNKTVGELICGTFIFHRPVSRECKPIYRGHRGRPGVCLATLLDGELLPRAAKTSPSNSANLGQCCRHLSNLEEQEPAELHKAVSASQDLHARLSHTVSFQDKHDVGRRMAARARVCMGVRACAHVCHRAHP